MKKTTLYNILGTLLISLLTVLPLINANAGTEVPSYIKNKGKIVFCTELAYPPWEMINAETQKPDGFDVDLAAAITNTLGVKSEHNDIGFDALIPSLQAGQCDAIISGLANRPKRREVVDFVDYAIAGNSLLTKADSNAYFNSLEDLSGLKVSVAVGSYLEDELKTANEAIKNAGKSEMKIISLTSGTDAFQQLVAGLADVYLGSTDQSGYFNKQKPGLVRIASPQLLTLTVGIATLHKDKDLHNAIKSALKEMMDNGEYQKVLDKWGFEAMTIE